jgi:hypothetical protein
MPHALWFWDETVQPARSWTWPLVYCRQCAGASGRTGELLACCLARAL